MGSMSTWPGRSLLEDNHYTIPHPKLPADEEQSAIILFLAICFLLGVFTHIVLNRVPIPYTALLLVWGLIIGLMEARGVHWTYFSYGIQFMRGLHPNMVLQIFLPVIGFSSGFAFDPHLIRKNLVQVFILAWPGVLVGGLMIGALAYATFGYDWSWKESFLFGAMLSATDPVAVVALLKEVGASAKLGIVIEGESLYNDGTGFVLFLIFRAMVRGAATAPLDIFKLFLQLAFGGLAIGFAFGAAAAFLLGYIQNVVAEVMLTLLTSYITYYTADHLCGTSGLLAVVNLGVTLSIFGGSRVSPLSKEPMKIFWELAEWMVNTIVFVYVGVIVGIVILSRDSNQDAEGESFIVGRDWAITLWLFVIIQICRLAMVVMFWPAMLYTGYPPTWRDILVISWAGLRGIVGLVIGLYIYEDDAIPNIKFRHLCLFHMGIMAAATIVINGATTGPLLKFLGMSSNSAAKLQVLNKVYQDTEKLGSEYVQRLKIDDPLGLPDLHAIMEETRLDATDVFKEAIHKSKAVEVVVQPPLATLSTWSRGHIYKVNAEAEAVLSDTRIRMLQAIKASFGEGFERGYINQYEILDLREAIDVSLDHPLHQLDCWAYLLRHGCHKPVLLERLGWLKLIPLLGPSIGAVLQRAMFNQLASHATMAAAYIFALRKAHKMLVAHLRHSAEDEFVPDFETREVAVRLIQEEGSKEMGAAMAFLRDLSATYPAVPRAVKTTQVCTSILKHKEHYLHLLFDGGLLDPKEHTELSSILEHRMKSLHISKFSRTLPTSKDLLLTHPLFQGMSLEEVSTHVWPHLIADVVDAGDLVCKAGAPVSHVLVILRGEVSYGGSGSSGAPHQAASASNRILPRADVDGSQGAAAQGTQTVVQVQLAAVAGRERSKDDQDTTLAAPHHLPLPGDAVGLLELLTEHSSHGRTASARTRVDLVRIAAPAFLTMLEALPSMHHAAWVEVAVSQFSAHAPAGMKGKKPEQLAQLFGDCTLQRVEPEQQLDVSSESYLVHGTVQVVVVGADQEDRFLTGPAVLPVGGDVMVIASTRCAVLHTLPAAAGKAPGSPGAKMSRLSSSLVRVSSSISRRSSKPYSFLPGQDSVPMAKED